MIEQILVDHLYNLDEKYIIAYGTINRFKRSIINYGWMLESARQLPNNWTVE